MDGIRELLKSFLGILLIVAVSFLIGCRYGRRTVRNSPEPHVIRDTVSYTIHDTITREKPVYVASYIYDTVRTYFTTIRRDTVLVDVPIERKVYEEDSLYRAVVSGPRFGKAGPSLDSLLVFSKTTTITVTNTVPEYIQAPRRRWSFGITAGPSVLATPSGQVHAGLGASVGLTYNF